MNVPQAVSHTATKPAERLYLDISSVNHRSLGGNKFWLLIVDDLTRMKWSFFLKAKSDLSSTVLHFLAKLQEHNYPPHIICLDNAGENLAFQKTAESKGLHLIFEFTAPNTPQQNGIVERAFATLYNRGRAMLTADGLKYSLKETLWAEFFSTATKLDVITSKDGSITSFKSFYTTNYNLITRNTFNLLDKRLT